MPNIVIYYRLQKDEIVENSVEKINKIILYLETFHSVKGVFLDSYNDRNQLHELLNVSLKEIDIMYTNQFFEDDFDSQLIKQLSTLENFSVIYLNEI